MDYKSLIADTNSQLMVLSMKVLNIALKHRGNVKEDITHLKRYLMTICESQNIQEKVNVIPKLSNIVTQEKDMNTNFVRIYLEQLVEEAAAAAQSDKLLEQNPNYFVKDEDLHLLYIKEMEPIWRIIANVFQHELLAKSVTGEENWFHNYMSFNSLLAKKEREWKEMGQKGLPPIHEHIKELAKDEDKTPLLNFLERVIKKSISLDFDLEVKSPVEMESEDFHGSNDKTTSAAFIASLGTSFSLGLTFLPQLVSRSAETAARSSYSIFSGAATTGGISTVQNLSAGVVSSALLAGVCLYNAYCVIVKERSIREAGKNILDQVVTTAVGFGWGVLVMSGLGLSSPALSLGLLFVGGAIVGAATYAIVDRFTRWLFGIPREEAPTEAYGVLGLKKNATMEEVRSAYRQKSREYHPDHMNQKGASEGDKAKGLEKFREVQNALQFIIQARMEEQQEGEKEGFLTKVSEMFAGLFRRNENSQAKPTILPIAST